MIEVWPFETEIRMLQSNLTLEQMREKEAMLRKEVDRCKSDICNFTSF